MKTLVATTILLIWLTDAMAQAPVVVQADNAAPAASPVQQRSAGSSTQDELKLLDATLSAISQNQQVSNMEMQTLQTVLVVPGPDVKPETIASITEDLMVMCRIFDKALRPGVRPTRTSAYVNRGELPLLGELLLQQVGRTQGLYLDGYGAIFFVDVDFPLIAPPQQQESQAQEPTDRVWSQTAGEIRGEQELRDADQNGPAYDAQKVENLKATLVRTLRHAANLRVRPQDQVTVVVGSRSPSAGSAQGQVEFYRWHHSTQDRRILLPGTNRTRPEHPEADAAATFVLRAGKADVDALAAGEITAEQFAAKVATLWSQAQPQAPEAATPPAR